MSELERAALIAEACRLGGPMPDPAGHKHYLETLDDVSLLRRVEALRKCVNHVMSVPLKPKYRELVNLNAL